MNVVDVIDRIASTKLIEANLRYCLVDIYKRPFKIDHTPARSNVLEDFVNLEDLLLCDDLSRYTGVGISVQASNICAIDVDSCFATENDISTADERAKTVIDLFKDCAYCEFSFSGRGLRVLFRHDVIADYNKRYYIKNGVKHVEYYQPSNSNRYVTLTGRSIANKCVDENLEMSDNALTKFLDTFMQRQVRIHVIDTIVKEETRSYEELMGVVRQHLFTKTLFQNVWFTNAPGSGKDESERDFYLMSYLYENITQDRAMIKQIFESSNFFKTKDWHHVKKWTSNDYRYFNYLYDLIRERHEK